MKCLFCNNEIPEDSLFCTHCGHKVEKKPALQIKFCTKCGHALKEGAKFCTGCGAGVEEMLQEALARQEKMQNAAGQESVGKPQPEQAFEQEPVGKSQPEQAFEQEPVEKSQPEQLFEQEPVRKAQPEQTFEQEPVRRPQTADRMPEQPEFVPEEPEDPLEPEQDAPKKKSGNGILIFAIVLTVLLLALIGVGFKFIVYDNYLAPSVTQEDADSKDTEDEEETKDDKEEADSEEDNTEEASSESTEEKKPVDIDLAVKDTIDVNCNFRKTTDGKVILKWTTPVSVRGVNDAGEEITQEAASGAYIDESSNLPDGFEDFVNAGEALRVSGKFHFVGQDLYVVISAVKNAQGVDLIQLYGDKDAYILPTSSTVALTEQDISSLTLQQINYAKNEIYARHGRKFDSQELQNYFNSKAWYNGTIAPADFNENVLSQIEKDNVRLLKDREFSISPNGYQLDQ